MIPRKHDLDVNDKIGPCFLHFIFEFWEK